MALIPSGDEKVPKANPLERPDYHEADVQALRALQIGNATPDQQKRACRFVLEVCGTYDMAFRPGPDGDRLTALALGKQWVGQCLVWFFNSAPTKTDRDEVAVRRSMQRSDP